MLTRLHRYLLAQAIAGLFLACAAAIVLGNIS